jgi:hypothetical protein
MLEKRIPHARADLSLIIFPIEPLIIWFYYFLCGNFAFSPYTLRTK